MQIIEKEKLIKTKVYIATDGTEFTDYDECQDYEAEFKLQRLLEHAVFYTRNQKRITSTNDILDKAYFIYFKDKKYIKDFVEALEYYGYAFTDGEIQVLMCDNYGMFYFNERCCQYRSFKALEDIFNKMKNED